MPVSLKTENELKKKAALFDAARGEAIQRIKEKVKVATEKLKAIETALLDEVEAEFSNNIFSSLLAKIDSEENCSDEEINSVLSEEIPSSFGPSEESFHTLLSEIDKFRAWNKKATTNSFDLIPQNLKCTKVTDEMAAFSWDKINYVCSYEIELRPVTTIPECTYHIDKPESTIHGLKQETEYRVRVRAVVENGNNTSCLWSDPITMKTTDKFDECIWKECPGYAENGMKYFVDAKNPRIATKIGGDEKYCTIIGNTHLPLNKVSSWSIKVLQSENNDGDGIYIGVAPSDINQNEEDNRYKCGWYFHCYSSTLRSGPPHSYKYPGKEYGPRKGGGEYVHNGDSVGVVMDTAKGMLSFALNGVNRGVVYERIPLDKPLVSCVLLYYKGDSIELVI